MPWRAAICQTALDRRRICYSRLNYEPVATAAEESGTFRERFIAGAARARRGVRSPI
jgi:hypothetical protein